MHDFTVKDSSIWQDESIHKIVNSSNTKICMGMVQEEVHNKLKDETYYIVDILDERGQHFVVCTRMSRFGSPYNYEEYTRQTYEVKDGDYAAKGRLDQRPGEVVVVALLNGGESEGIILGSINHPYRSETLKRNNEVAYVSEFNGIEEYIAKDGEWRLTYRGIQKNIADLRKAPDGNALPHPEYDNEIGTGYMEWDKTGSFFVTDNASDKLPQSLHINKKDGKIVITSGKTELTIDKKKESYSIKNKEFTIESLDKFSLKTKKTKIESTDLIEIISKETKIKSKIFQEGDIKIKGKVESEGDFKLKGKIDHDGDTKHSGNVSIGANLESSGMTKLSGGAKPLITDIIMIMGTGNLGMPVMSTATILTTTKTKAT